MWTKNGGYFPKIVACNPRTALVPIVYNESQEQPAYLYFILYLPLGQIHRFIVTNLIRESYFTLSAIIINSCESPTYNIPLSLSLCCLLSALELSLSLCSPECTMYYGP
uniref:Uncharacterized protein n=1 Tax=Cacopsylla melanoneura TaxID=428564 RepID=A0A8D9E7W5_9HEMI